MTRPYARRLRVLTPSRLVTLEPTPDRWWSGVLVLAVAGAAIVTLLILNLN